MDFLMLLGIEAIIGQLSGAMITLFALGPMALPLLISFANELMRELSLLGFQSMEALGEGLQKLKKLNHKAYTELLKALIALQQRKLMLTKSSKQKVHTKPAIKTPAYKKLVKLLKKIAKTPKKAAAAYKKAKVGKLKTSFKKKNYVLAKSIKSTHGKMKKAANKPSNTYALKAAFKEIGKKEYSKELKGSHKAAAMKPSH